MTGEKKEKKTNIIVSTYLLAYNLTACIGWAYVLSICFKHISAGSYDQLWTEVENPLKLVQTAAFLEVVHSLLGFVRSPFVTTFLQVFSRVWVLWACMNISVEANTSIFMTLACTSWGLVEVPRYMFYALDGSGMCPHVLKVIRYSLFAILYPTGITGELGCMYHIIKTMWETKNYSLSISEAINKPASTLFFWLVFVVLTYIPGSPKMYMHMVKARRNNLNPKKENKKTE